MFSHLVFFKLKTNDAAARKALVDGCYKYLSGHDGVVAFAAGEIAEEMDRDVNVRDFDVSLTVVFRDKAAHDAYQDAPDHHKFIEEFNADWASVRVFDSHIAPDGLKTA